MDGLDLKIERIRKGIRQYELAQLAGVRPNELSLYENGRGRLSTEKLARVTTALESAGKEAIYA